MAIAFDNVTPSDANSHGTTVSSRTSTAYAVAGANRYQAGWAGCQTTTPADATNMKWGGAGGTGFTKLATGVAANAFCNMVPFGLIAPTAASQTLFADWATTKDEVAIGAVSYTGVDQTNPLRNAGVPTSNTGSFTGTSGTASVVVSNTQPGDKIVVGVWADDNGFHNPSIAATGGSTRRHLSQNSSDTAFAILEIDATGTSTTIQATITTGASGTIEWSAFAMALVPVAPSAGKFVAFPNKGPIPKSYGARTIGFKQGIAVQTQTATPSLPLALLYQAQVRTTQEELPPPVVPSLRSFLTGTQTVGQPWHRLFQPVPVRFELEPYQPTQSFNIHRYRQWFQTISRPNLYQPPLRIPELEQVPPPQVDLRLFYGRTTPVIPTAGQPWYLWPQLQRQEEAQAYKPERTGDLHLYRFSFQTVGQPWALFAGVSIPHVEPELVAPIVPSTQLFYGHVPAVATPGQPWFMWKGYQPQFDTEIFRQPEIPSLLLVYGRPQVTPPVSTGIHQVNLSASFGIGLNWMGTRI